MSKIANALNYNLTNGQLAIGHTGNPATLSTLTAGNNVSITNGAGSITVNASLGTLINVQYLNSGTGATYTPTAGTVAILVQAVGGGGSGGGPSAGSTTGSGAGGGGGGGGFCQKLITGINSATYTGTYTIGAGGAALTNAQRANAGNAGSATTYSDGTVSLSAGGGGAGTAGVAASSGTPSIATSTFAGGGTATGGDLNINGGSGGTGLAVWTSSTNAFGIPGMNGMSYLSILSPNIVAGSGQVVPGYGNIFGAGSQGGAFANSTASVIVDAGSTGTIRIYEYGATGSAGGGASGTLLNVRYLTTGTSATYTPTSGTNAIFIACIGGGGGGGSSGTNNGVSTSPGGGGGGYAAKFIGSINSSSYTATYTIGPGGAGGASGGTASAGSNGTATTWSDGTNSLSAGGGTGGTSGQNVNSSTVSLAFKTGGAGGTSSGGSLNMPGVPGANSSIINVSSSSALVSAGVGGGTYISPGPTSTAAIGNTGSPSSSVGVNGTANTGVGGSGDYQFYTGSTSPGGGTGGSGLITVWEFS